MNELYNKKNKDQLIHDLSNESFNRITLSFYKYVKLQNLLELRDLLYENWKNLGVLGRIYIAEEGINAQISIPEHNLKNFKENLNEYKSFQNTPFKMAVKENISFYKLIIKVKKEIVAYGINIDEYDINETGKHLNAKEFNSMMNQPNSVIVDMRNHYESEVGKFEKAICPDVDRSKELLPETKKILKKHQNDNILLYCTGGIRCEKASSYLIKNKFKNVFQLKGGIINYAKEVKEQKIESKFKGKNFVFDDRLGERITDDILSKCHQCEDACDNHTNCANDACHLLFIQCNTCKQKFNGCCSQECREIQALPIKKQKDLRKQKPELAAPLIHHYRDRIKPKLTEMLSKKYRDLKNK
tara:strand:- start:6680 stop:7750 length:1071 start_codon:yes stop_codon:yes gene_type:complete